MLFFSYIVVYRCHGGCYSMLLLLKIFSRNGDIVTCRPRERKRVRLEQALPMPDGDR